MYDGPLYVASRCSRKGRVQPIIAETNHISSEAEGQGTYLSLSLVLLAFQFNIPVSLWISTIKTGILCNTSRQKGIKNCSYPLSNLVFIKLYLLFIGLWGFFLNKKNKKIKKIASRLSRRSICRIGSCSKSSYTCK